MFAAGMIGAALVSAAASAYSQHQSAQLGAAYSGAMLRRQIRGQKQLMAYQHALNSPLQQITDLRAAGLNPNLVYQGNPAMSTSIAPAASGGSNHVDIDPKLDLVNAILTAQRIKQGDSAVNQSDATTANLKADKEGKEIANDIAKEKLKQEEIKTKNYQLYGSDKPTLESTGVGLGKRFAEWAVDKVKNANKVTPEEARDKTIIDKSQAVLREFSPASHSGRAGMTDNGVTVESPNQRMLHQEITDPYIVVEGKKYRRDLEAERRSAALEAERLRRKANAAKDRRSIRQYSNELRHHQFFGEFD